jgi:glycosyltransferase involved in cell wall biosynthesis
MFPLGPSNQLSLLAQELVKRGAEVHLAILKDRPSTGFRLPSDCHIHHLEITRHDWMGWNQLRKLAKSIQPTVCHDFSVAAMTRVAIGDTFPQVSTQFRAPNAPKPTDWIRQKFVERNAATPHHFVATHSIVADELIAQRVPEGSIMVIPPAVDRETEMMPNARQFVLNEYGLPKDSVIVGTYAPLVPATRLKDLIWAIDLITCIRDDVQLLIMGQGGQLDRLRRFSRCTAADSHIHFIGCPVRSPQVLSGLDVYWNSHLLWPLPNSLLSAMNFGVPAISVLGPETESLIQHQTTGFGVNLGARDEFARWTKYLIEQTESAQQLASQGQEHVRRGFSVGSFIESYLKIYGQFQ